jgi:predicted ATPase
MGRLKTYPPNSLLLIGNPEAYLVPLEQQIITDLILNQAKERNYQIIMTTHSETILRRCQRRIAEGVYSADDFQLYLGSTDLTYLNLSEFGELENYPTDFFGNEMAEIAETRKAILLRRNG